MDESTPSQKTKLLVPLVLVVIVGFVIPLSVFVLSHRRPSFNDAIGRYQMQVTDQGTIVIMDTVIGKVTNVSRVDEYHRGERVSESKQPQPNAPGLVVKTKEGLE